ncbi:MAG: bacteriocin fulvocin C-related protein [Bacteroidales bacterium]|nr:bacteriocin fulvocin C-related protein [Bacteroidales bacterium]
MKMLRSFSFLMFLVTLISCSKTLSCDPLINEWAKANCDYYELASREEIISLPMSRQRAIYVGLSGERKVQLWREKAKMVIETGILTEDEKCLYQELFNYITPYHYETKQGSEELLCFVVAWKERVLRQYNWDEMKLFYLTNIWMTEDEFYNAILADNLYTKSGGNAGINTKTCECIYSVYCSTSGLGSTCSTYPSCRQGTNSCGIVGSSNCTGTCQ